MADDTGEDESSKEIITEDEVSIEVVHCKKQAEQLKFFNPKLSMARKAVLATLRIEVEAVDRPLLCLDAFASSGIAGLQWKKHLREKVHVVLADKEVEPVRQACTRNEMKYSDWLLNASHVTGEWPSVSQRENEIHITPFQAGVVLHHEAFNFIYVQANHSTALYTDAIFTNVRHNGVVCFLSQNIASQCFRSPQLITRQYQAYVQKTEYVKEMAARLVLADIARAAARHQRGIEVLYTLYTEDHFLITVRVFKNNQAAVCTAENCRQLLHCLMCEERVIYPDIHNPVENPYSLLPCDCKEKYPGKTAVILGPLWTADIFSVAFLERLIANERQKSSKHKLYIILNTLLSEAACRAEGDCASIDETVEKTTKRPSSWKEFRENSCGEPVKKKPKIENGSESENSQESKGTTDKRTCFSDNSENKQAERCKEDCELSPKSAESINGGSAVHGVKSPKSENMKERNRGKEHQVTSDMPIFYYDLKSKKFSGFPKLERLVTLLRAGGFRASRTHFEHQAIRTNATVKQLQEVVQKVVPKLS